MKRRDALQTPFLSTATALKQIKEDIEANMGDQVSNLSIYIDNGGLILRGRAYSAQAKQLVQDSLTLSVAVRIQANEIEVRV